MVAASVGVLTVTAALYYLSLGEEETSLDKKVFTKEKLEKFYNETLLEYTCILCRNYNLMLKVMSAKDGVFSDEDMG